MKKIISIIFILPLLGLIACDPKRDTTTDQANAQRIDDMLPLFDQKAENAQTIFNIHDDQNWNEDNNAIWNA
ncbi:hypothetical protein bcCo53_001129 (plasmid) [Borrelia coriaceae]|uniref:Lipoprotein n=1 Tax=Borrelia coriaceae ATCC 43381 TaxID=1408429 RepID=W5SW99_9SPIR|nr:hypothetical protein [Borrelia coriaceae]AHH11167.1 hypothetical protein BCO_0900036 [Borrelia coriaceae ATCC 43381]UPA16961.1 hypothetical protein bcCo53_001129 [Borrelia coriaceae]